jgi:hypothetical protein
MFDPYQKLMDLTVDGSYWKKNIKNCNSIFSKNHTKFWGKGFELLQNIEDRSTLLKHVKHARDPILMVTINKNPDEANKNQTDFSDIDQVADILEMGLQSR